MYCLYNKEIEGVINKNLLEFSFILKENETLLDIYFLNVSEYSCFSLHHKENLLFQTTLQEQLLLAEWTMNPILYENYKKMRDANCLMIIKPRFHKNLYQYYSLIYERYDKLSRNVTTMSFEGMTNFRAVLVTSNQNVTMFAKISIREK